jgi:hypothetical protein
MISFSDAKSILSKFTVTGAQKAHIDRLVFELGIMEKEFASLQQQLVDKNALIADLSSKVMDLTAELELANRKSNHDSECPDGFDGTTDEIVKIMFKVADDISKEQIARSLGLELGIVQFHFDLLGREKMVRQTRLGFKGYSGHSPAGWQLSGPGRAYAVNLKRSEQAGGGGGD